MVWKRSPVSDQKPAHISPFIFSIVVPAARGFFEGEEEPNCATLEWRATGRETVLESVDVVGCLGVLGGFGANRTLEVQF